MKFLTSILNKGLLIGLTILTGYVFWSVSFTNLGVGETMHEVAKWLPALGLFAVISAQMDLGMKIQAGEEVNIRARCMDFVHWFLLIFLNIGAWQDGGVNISWFILKVILVGVIGWSIGIGIKRLYTPTKSDKVAGAISLTIAIILGLVAGYIRNTDVSSFGWGWWLETTTAILATIIVFFWIREDMKTISVKYTGYSRSYFWKGILSNSLVLVFWGHMITNEVGLSTLDSSVKYLGLTVNVVLGNLIYFAYYFLYEYHRRKQSPMMEQIV